MALNRGKNMPKVAPNNDYYYFVYHADGNIIEYGEGRYNMKYLLPGQKLKNFHIDTFRMLNKQHKGMYQKELDIIALYNQ